MMFLFASVALARSVDPAAIGLAGVPNTPDVCKPTGTHKERMEAIRSGERPEMLVPCYYEKYGKKVTANYWHDGQGNVWTRSEVVAMLAADPASTGLAKRGEGLDVAGRALIVGGGMAALATVVLVPVTVPVVAVAAGMIAVEAGGLCMFTVGRNDVLEAAQAYNLAHAQVPDIPENS